MLLYAQGMHRGRFLVLTKQGGWLTPPLTPVHKNTVRNGKSERISNLKERVRIILVWCGRQELNLHGCPPVPKTGVSAIPPRPRIHLIVIKAGKRRHSFRYSLQHLYNNKSTEYCCPAVYTYKRCGLYIKSVHISYINIPAIKARRWTQQVREIYSSGHS